VYTHSRRTGNSGSLGADEEVTQAAAHAGNMATTTADDRHDDDDGRWPLGLSVGIFLGLAIARR